MSKDDRDTSHDPPDTARLRNRAQEIIKGRSITVAADRLSKKEAQLLVHELQVHQIELEMQNEELRRSQQMLEESRERFSDLYDFAPVGYLTLDKVGNVIEANLTGASLLGEGRTSLIGKPFVRHVARDSQDAFYNHRKKVLESDKQQTCELVLMRKGGVQFYAEMKSDRADSKTIRTTVSDISGRKQAEQERERVVEELKEALQNIKTLKGLLPICSWCGKIRDDKGYWQKVETYFEKHSDLTFTHGMCDQCLIKWEKGEMENHS